MFLVTGSFKRGNKIVTYTEERLSASELAEIFDIDRESHHEFEYTSNRKKRDLLNGGERKPRGLMLDAMFSGTWNGSTLTIRYFKSKVPNIQDGRTVGDKYLPNKVPFREGRLFPGEDLEQIVFLSLHPWNENSPVKSAYGHKYFKTRNRRVESINELGLYERINATQNEIISLSKTDVGQRQLRQAAKGITILGNRLAVGPVVSDEEVTAMLIRALNQHKDDFIKAWEQPITQLRGMIMVAMDRNILVLKRQGEYNAIYWQDGALVTRAPSGSDVPNAIATYMLNSSDGLELLKKHLDGSFANEQAMLRREEILEASKISFNPNDVEAIIEEAFAKGVIEWDKKSGMVAVAGTIGTPRPKWIIKDATDREGDPSHYLNQLAECLTLNTQKREDVVKLILKNA